MEDEEENCSQTHTKLSFYGVREKNSDLFTEKLIFGVSGKVVYIHTTLIRRDKEFSTNREKKIIGRSFLFDNYMRERIFSFITKSTNGTDFFLSKSFHLYTP